MKRDSTKKELQQLYKERQVVGGVFAIKNSVNGKTLIDSAADMQGSKNRFEFSKSTGSCTYLKLQGDWSAHGGEAFTFEALEELEKGAGQSDSEFKADLGVLKELWLEKYDTGELY